MYGADDLNLSIKHLIGDKARFAKNPESLTNRAVQSFIDRQLIYYPGHSPNGGAFYRQTKGGKTTGTASQLEGTPGHIHCPSGTGTERRGSIWQATARTPGVVGS